VECSASSAELGVSKEYEGHKDGNGYESNDPFQHQLWDGPMIARCTGRTGTCSTGSKIEYPTPTGGRTWNGRSRRASRRR